MLYTLTSKQEIMLKDALKSIEKVADELNNVIAEYHPDISNKHPELTFMVIDARVKAKQALKFFKYS